MVSIIRIIITVMIAVTRVINLVSRPGERFASEEPGPRGCTVSSAMGALDALASDGVTESSAVIVSVRPEDVELSQAAPAARDGVNVCRGKVSAADFLGDYLDFRLEVGNVVLVAKAHPSMRTSIGEYVYLRMRADRCVAIPGEPGASRRAR